MHLHTLQDAPQDAIAKLKVLPQNWILYKNERKHICKHSMITNDGFGKKCQNYRVESYANAIKYTLFGFFCSLGGRCTNQMWFYVEEKLGMSASNFDRACLSAHVFDMP